MKQGMSKLENNHMTREEFHVSSLVVLTQPPLRHRLAEQIAALDGAEIHAVSDEGKLVVTLEGPSQRPITAARRAMAEFSSARSRSSRARQPAHSSRR